MALKEAVNQYLGFSVIQQQGRHTKESHFYLTIRWQRLIVSKIVGILIDIPGGF